MFQVMIERNGKIEIIQGNIEDQYKAESAFLRAVENTISNFDEYSSDDVDAIIEQGYENFGSGSIYLEEV